MRLPETLDLAAASSLKADFIAARGAAVDVDASAVERLGGPCLQVLLSAWATWKVDGQAIRLVNPSEAFTQSARRMAADLVFWGE